MNIALYFLDDRIVRGVKEKQIYTSIELNRPQSVNFRAIRDRGNFFSSILLAGSYCNI